MAKPFATSLYNGCPKWVRLSSPTRAAGADEYVSVEQRRVEGLH